MADIQLPDGNFVRLPDYALESTQSQMLKIMQAQLGANGKASKLYAKMLDQAKSDSKNTDKNQKETKQASQKRNQTLKQLLKEAEQNNKNLKFAMTAGRDLGSSFRSIVGLGVAASGLAVSLTRVTRDAVMGFGNTLTELTQQGVGLTGVRGSALAVIADLQQLGFSAADASSTMAAFSSTVQTLGKTEFSNMQKQFASLTGLGSEFGMTMSEMSTVLSEDLEIRQQLGILQSLDQHRQVQRSRDLFDLQMRAASVLGKSIDDLRKMSQAVAEDPITGIRMQQLNQQFGDGASDVLTSLGELASTLASMGLPQEMITGITEGFMAVAPFGTDQADTVRRALETAGVQGRGIINAVVEAQRDFALAADRGDRAAMGRIQKRFQNIIRAAEGLEQVSGQNLSLQAALLSGGDQTISMIVQAQAQVAQYMRNLRNADSEIDGLMTAAATFQNAFNVVLGSLQSAATIVVSGFSEPMSRVANAFTDDFDEAGNKVDSVFKTIAVAGGEISQALTEMLGPFLGLDKGANDLRVTLNNIVTNFRDQIITGIEDFGKYLQGRGGISGLMESAIDTFSNIVDTLGTAYRIFESIVGFLDKLFVKRNTQGDFEGIRWSVVLAVPLAKALASGLIAVFASALVKRAVATSIGSSLAGLFGVKAATAGAGAAGAASVGAGAAAKTGMFAKAGAGLAALAGGKALLAIAGIAAAATALAVIASKMGVFKAIAQGLAEFNEVDGGNLIKVGAGMAAFGAGMAVLGVGAAAGAIGGVVANIWEGLSNMFGGRSILERLRDFGNFSGINVRGVERNSEAAAAFGQAMASLNRAMGATRQGVFSNLIGSIWEGLSEMHDVPSLMQQLRDFGQDRGINSAGIRRNAAAVEAFGRAMASLAGADSFMSALIREGISVNIMGLRATLVSFSSVLDVMDEEFVQKLQSFGRIPLGGHIQSNSDKVVYFAQALKELDDVGRFANVFKDGFFGRREEKFTEALGNLGSHLTTFSKMGDGVSAESLEASASMLSRMAGVYERFSKISSTGLTRSAMGIGLLNDALMMSRDIPAPDTNAANTSTVDNLDQAEAQFRRLAELSNGDKAELVNAVIESNQTTHRLLRDLNTSIQNM